MVIKELETLKAKSYLEAIIETLCYHDLLKHLVYISTDGAAVMIGE